MTHQMTGRISQSALVSSGVLQQSDCDDISLHKPGSQDPSCRGKYNVLPLAVVHVLIFLALAEQAEAILQEVFKKGHNVCI